MKKILTIAMAAMLVLTVFVGCGKKETETSEIYNSFDSALAEVEGAKLSEEKMLAAVHAYFDYINEDFLDEGSLRCEVTVHEDGSITVDSIVPELDADGNRTGGEVRETAFEWTSVKEAYATLYENGIVDLEGNVLVSASNTHTEAPEGENAPADESKEVTDSKEANEPVTDETVESETTEVEGDAVSEAA